MDHWVVDVLGRSKRFHDHDARAPASGRVGLVRLRVPVGHYRGVNDVGTPEPVFERSLDDISLTLEVSLTDWVAVVGDAGSGFRRVFPLGGGSIDRGVRNRGVITSLTPTTEDGRMEKRHAFRKLGSPWYFKKKPYLPISVARTFTHHGGKQVKAYVESNIAFHIWQDKGFERGFFSHGCMRMRTEDLAEMAAFVFGAEDPIPVKMRMAPRDDAYHPFPWADRFFEMLNVGTAERPKYTLENLLFKTIQSTGELPRADELQPVDFLGKPIAPPS
jgi:hypothetical protein